LETTYTAPSQNMSGEKGLFPLFIDEELALRAGKAIKNIDSTTKIWKTIARHDKGKGG
jgi:hypothetical protein